MEKSWFKYGNFDTRDYPNLLIELLPNRNISERNTDQVSVFGQNGVIAYPGGLKNTSRTYNIALISDEDDRINHFGTLARFIDMQLRSQNIRSELTDSYLVFPDEELPPATKWGASTKYSNIAHNRKVYYIASYINSETITNLYNIAARVTVTFNTSPIYYSFEGRSYLASATSSLLYIYFNDDRSISPSGDRVKYPFLFLFGDGEGVIEQKYWQPVNDFWFKNSELKLHAKALKDRSVFDYNIYYQGVYYANYPSGMHADTIFESATRLESRLADGTRLYYNKDDEITVNLQNGEITDKFEKRCIRYKLTSPHSKFFTFPMSLSSYDNQRQPFVTRSYYSGSPDNLTMYNGRMVFGLGDCAFSLEVIKHG